MKLCYLIGYPVSHSMSAVMHNSAFKALGLNFRYELRSVPPEELREFLVSVVRKPDVRGANITIPHKVSVIDFLDELDRAASRIGAVNAIVNEGGILKGYNSDGIGAVKAIEEVYGRLEGVKAVVLGAGGAARAVGYHLSTTVKEICIANRTLRRAVELAEKLSGHPECKARILAIRQNGERLKDVVENADILINATPVGMSPKIGETPILGELLNKNLLVFDLVYNPMRTRLIKDAEAAGARVLTGVSMLVYQGAESFKLWTGVEAPYESMHSAVVNTLGG